MNPAPKIYSKIDNLQKNNNIKYMYLTIEKTRMNGGAG